MQSSTLFTDINNFYQEIMFLRNAVQVLFSEKQWAALNYVGRRIGVMKTILNTDFACKTGEHKAADSNDRT